MNFWCGWVTYANGRVEKRCFLKEAGCDAWLSSVKGAVSVRKDREYREIAYDGVAERFGADA
jgi:hypothetical protein